MKLGQIIDLLLAAGYFRARISTLPPFDKVQLPVHCSLFIQIKEHKKIIYIFVYTVSV